MLSFTKQQASGSSSRTGRPECLWCVFIHRRQKLHKLFSSMSAVCVCQVRLVPRNDKRAKKKKAQECVLSWKQISDWVVAQWHRPTLFFYYIPHNSLSLTMFAISVCQWSLEKWEKSVPYFFYPIHISGKSENRPSAMSLRAMLRFLGQELYYHYGIYCVS